MRTATQVSSLTPIMQMCVSFEWECFHLASMEQTNKTNI